jgi:hypothetical protein
MRYFGQGFGTPEPLPGALDAGSVEQGPDASFTPDEHGNFLVIDIDQGS